MTKADVLDNGGENPGILNALGLARHKLHEWGDASDSFNLAIEKAKTNEDLVEFYCNRADFYYDRGFYAEAAGDLDKARGYYAEAAKDLDLALEKDNTNSKVHY